MARGGVGSTVVLLKPQERMKRLTVLNKQTNGVAVIINPRVLGIATISFQ